MPALKLLRRAASRALVAVLLVVSAACATRTVPALPTVLSYPEFMYPVVPPPLAASPAAAGVDHGWRYLQNDDLASAEREFTAAAMRMPGLYPAQAGAAYVALARRDYARAAAGFEGVLRNDSAYVPALVGRGQALLALKRDEEALQAFEAALAADASLVDVRRRVDVLRFRVLQQVIETARAAGAAGRMDEARTAYDRALQASPESAFLHRELGLLERRQGNQDAALTRFRRASELDPADAVSFTHIGEILEARQDFEGAAMAYRRAADLEPSAQLSARIAAVNERGRDARLPEQFRAIAAAPRVTRGQLAALIGVRLEDLLRGAPVTEVVITDGRGHWAAAWIAQVTRAGVIEPFANHTFQPDTPITRADLAAAVSRIMTLLAVTRPDVRPALSSRQEIADMPPGHLSYGAASAAVASGVMSLTDGRFDPAGAVTGAEAIAVVTRLRALAGLAR
jgi:tetratricopeptide (TPR) repeat protein